MAEKRKRAPSGGARYHHGDLRAALVEAAVGLVAEGSVRDVSLREVARRAGVTYAAPYHHFADKSALLAAVATQGFERLLADLERAMARRKSLRSELQAAAETYLAFALDHPAHYRVMFLPEVKHSPEATQFHVAASHAFESLLSRVVRARPNESERSHLVLATTVWAALHGLSLLAIDRILQVKLPQPEKTLRDACHRIVDMVLPSE